MHGERGVSLAFANRTDFHAFPMGLRVNRVGALIVDLHSMSEGNECMPQTTTLQDVAEQAGVHRSTVSLALRGNTRISAEVRERVTRIANQLGYRANPLVTALMRARRTRKTTKDVVIAYVTNYPTRYGWRPPHHDRPDFFPGAAQRAQELGYKLEDFWLGEPGMTPKRFAQILTTRGINGLLIGRLPPGQSELDLPWDRFSCVALGLTLKNPRLHHVAEDAYATADEAINRCLAAGHRRIGLVFSEPDDSPNTGDRYRGAFLRHQLRFPAKERIPICDHSSPAEFPGDFMRWVKCNEPEVILATHAEAVARIYAGAGQPLPAGVRLVALINDKLPNGFAGIHHDPAEMGAQAVNLLVGMMHRGEVGIPEEAHYLLVPGKWVEGRVR
jgi:DNA-binding LacI/PurR family transcriptional regulator